MQSSMDNVRVPLRETLFQHMTKRPDQNLFNKGKEIQEHVRVVRAHRQEGPVKGVVTQSDRKEKGDKENNAKPKKGGIPRM